MVKWIVLGVVLLGLATLAIAVRPVLARLPRLRRAVLALQRRQTQAESLQRGVMVLQERIVVLQRQAQTAGDRIAVIKAKRDD